MKYAMTVLSAVFFFFVSVQLEAQIRTPAPSPTAVLKQAVGLTDITIEYSRPGVKDRKIFGELVPFNEVWRVGANSAVKFSFSTDVKVSGHDLKAGDYAFLAKPGESEWKFMFYPYESTNFGSYIEKEPAAAFSATSQSTGEMKVESFTIDIGTLRNSSANILLLWENTMVGFEVTVPTEELVMSSIESTMSGPSANEYYGAASYYFSEGKDMAKAHKWVSKACEMNNEAFWMFRLKSQIEAELGDYKTAIMSAKASKELAEKAGNAQFVKFNEDAIAMWEKKMK